MQQFEYRKAICYSGYRKGQSPKGAMPTREQIEEDIKILADLGYGYLRMYDPNEHARLVLETIRKYNYPIKCIVGIDSDNEINNPGCPFEDQQYTPEELKAHAERNDRELDKLIELVKEFDDEIFAVSVGNENTPPWGQHMVSEERLIGHVRKLKANLNKPVTFCEGVSDWPNIPDLAKEVDFIAAHNYPYHYSGDIDSAVSDNKEFYKKMQELFPDKQIIYTEVGWSSRATDKPHATLENEKRYITELKEWLEEDKVIAFIFEAFDELWKGDRPEASECNFGLYNEDRQPKW